MFGVQSKPKTKHDNVSNIRPVAKPPAKPPQGRERLKHFDEQLSLARQALSELQQRVERCEGIIADADVNHRALQSAITADGGKDLANYSAGLAEEGSIISKLVLAADNSGRASTAAKASLPSAHAALEDVQQQIVALTDERAVEMHRVLLSLGDVEAQQYQAAFDKLCHIYDRLTGVASIIEANIGDVMLTTDSVKIPRFQFPSSGHPDADIFLRHKPSSLTVSEAARQYTQVRERLENDALADLSDLF